MNDITEETRNKLKIGVILIVILFLIIYGVFMHFKYVPSETKAEIPQSGTVIFDQPTLTFFSLKNSLNSYPDRITVHYPYLIIVRPDNWMSEIYNMDTKKKEKEVSEVILDYFDGDMVYNKQGFVTYYNDKSMRVLCDRAFIKSSVEVLCVTRPDKNKQENRLISINTQNLLQKDLHMSQNVITAVYYDKDNLYIAEYDFTAQKASIMVNNMSTLVNDLVNVIYPINSKFYAASFKSLRNNKTESYYEIIASNNNLSVKLIERGEIVFYK